jgi:hypothetical protein
MSYVHVSAVNEVNDKNDGDNGEVITDGEYLILQLLTRDKIPT